MVPNGSNKERRRERKLHVWYFKKFYSKKEYRN